MIKKGFKSKLPTPKPPSFFVNQGFTKAHIANSKKKKFKKMKLKEPNRMGEMPPGDPSGEEGVEE